MNVIAKGINIYLIEVSVKKNQIGSKIGCQGQHRFPNQETRDSKVLLSLMQRIKPSRSVTFYHHFSNSLSHLLFCSLLEVMVGGQVVNIGSVIAEKMNIYLFPKPIQFVLFSSIQVLATLSFI